MNTFVVRQLMIKGCQNNTAAGLAEDTAHVGGGHGKRP